MENVQAISFEHNMADTDGGALCAVGTHIKMSDSITFASNRAKKGGAIIFKDWALNRVNKQRGHSPS